MDMDVEDGMNTDPQPSSQEQNLPQEKLSTFSPGLSLISQFESSQESDDSSSDSSDDTVVLVSDNELVEWKSEAPVPEFCPKVKGEIDYRDLPNEIDCDITFPENGKVLSIGEVSHYTEKLLVIKSFPDTPAVNEGTVLWRGDKTSIARVFETFGPVKTPFYSILVQSKDQAEELGLKPGDPVYVVPGDLELTNYVFTNKLLKEKGCDASWKNDIEMPLEYQDCSDDELESLKKRKKKKGQNSEVKNVVSPEKNSSVGSVSSPRVGSYSRPPVVKNDSMRLPNTQVQHNFVGSPNPIPCVQHGSPNVHPHIQSGPYPMMYPPNAVPGPFSGLLQGQPPYPFQGQPPPPPGYYPWPRYPPPYQ